MLDFQTEERLPEGRDKRGRTARIVPGVSRNFQADSVKKGAAPSVAVGGGIMGETAAVLYVWGGEENHWAFFEFFCAERTADSGSNRSRVVLMRVLPLESEGFETFLSSTYF